MNPPRALATKALDGLAKPVGSLGRLEDLVVELSVAQNQYPPNTDHLGVVIFAGDHGVNAPIPGKDPGPFRVSAFPSAVTTAMVHTIASGGSTVSAMARSADAHLRLVNVGVAEPSLSTLKVTDADATSYVHVPIAMGTKDFETGPAMTSQQLADAIQHGRSSVLDFVAKGTKVLAVGELGIGNTASASAVAALVLNKQAKDLVGPGTGVTSEGLNRKVEVIQNSLDRCRKTVDDASTFPPMEALSQVGGFEIAAMVGCYLQCAESNVAAIVDGFISSTAALVATQVNPQCKTCLIFATASKEPGHAIIMEAIQPEFPPLLDWGLRLGEGSGAALCLPLIRTAGRVVSEVVTLKQVMEGKAN